MKAFHFQTVGPNNKELSGSEQDYLSREIRDFDARQRYHQLNQSCLGIITLSHMHKIANTRNNSIVFHSHQQLLSVTQCQKQQL